MGKLPRWRLALFLLLAALLAPLLRAAPPARRAEPASPLQRWLNAMTPRQRAAQLVMIKSTGALPPTRSRAYRVFVQSVQTDGVGGVGVNNRVGRAGAVNAEPFAIVSFLNRMQKLSRIPLLIGGDFERGASMRVAGTIKYPHAMAFAATGSPEYSRELGRATAREARALGVHWIYAPDADVNNNPANPIINIRSYGENPHLVAQHVKAYLEGARRDPDHTVLVTLKHFPGHGDTAVDSHAGMPRLDVDRERLNRIELVPFRAGIAAGVDSVMTAHIALPAVDPSGEPATVSKPVITGLLRGELAFEGIVSTDAMDMAGLAARYNAWTPASARSSPPKSASALKRTVSCRPKSSRMPSTPRARPKRRRRLPAAPSRSSATEPACYPWPKTPAPAFCSSPSGKATPTYRPSSTKWPCAPRTSRSVCSTRRRPHSPRPPTAARWCWGPMLRSAATAQATPRCRATIRSSLTNSSAPANRPFCSASVTPSLGTPYMIRAFPEVSTYFTTYSPAATSETAAVRALFGDAPMTGKKVVTVE